MRKKLCALLQFFRRAFLNFLLRWWVFKLKREGKISQQTFPSQDALLEALPEKLVCHQTSSDEVAIASLVSHIEEEIPLLVLSLEPLRLQILPYRSEVVFRSEATHLYWVQLGENLREKVQPLLTEDETLKGVGILKVLNWRPKELRLYLLSPRLS
ncbi:hypothetical protein J7L13_02740 [bacterium]|nr:hypothetical protein [bacterium]